MIDKIASFSMVILEKFMNCPRFCRKKFNFYRKISNFFGIMLKKSVDNLEMIGNNQKKTGKSL
jgi:hypothetical protein